MIELLLVVSLGAAPESPEVAAKEAFTAAQTYYKQAQYLQAIEKFQQADDLKPAPVLKFNIGKCHEQLGNLSKAVEFYRRYADLAPDAKDRSDVLKAIAVLEARVQAQSRQRVTIQTEPASARITIDGRELENSPATLDLPAGTHSLVVQAPGYERVERTFIAEQSGQLQLTIVLKAKQVEFTPPPPPPLVVDVPKAEKPMVVDVKPASVLEPVPPKPGRRFTWVAGGLAVAGLGAGIGLSLAAQETAQQVPNAPLGQAGIRAQEAETLGTAAGVSFGVAGAAAVTAIILFILEGQ